MTDSRFKRLSSTFFRCVKRRWGSVWCLRELSTDSASSLGFTKLPRPFLLNVYVSGPQHYSSGSPSLTPVKSSATASTCFHWKRKKNPPLYSVCTINNSQQLDWKQSWALGRFIVSLTVIGWPQTWLWVKQTAAHPPLVSTLWFITCTFRHLKKNIKTFNQGRQICFI